MDRTVVITDTYGDKLEVTESTWVDEIRLEATVADHETMIILDRKGAKQLRKALKKFITAAS